MVLLLLSERREGRELEVEKVGTPYDAMVLHRVLPSKNDGQLTAKEFQIKRYIKRKYQNLSMYLFTKLTIVLWLRVKEMIRYLN